MAPPPIGPIPSSETGYAPFVSFPDKGMSCIPACGDAPMHPDTPPLLTTHVNSTSSLSGGLCSISHVKA